MKKCLILLALICRQLAMFSQFTVSGSIKDENGAPLAGASVVIENTFKGSVSDAKGMFHIPGLKKGEAILKVSFLGYEPVERKIVLQKDEVVDIQLERKAFLADEVVVIATRAGNTTPVAYSTVSKEEISRKNQGQDVPYLLALTPSLVTTSDAGAGVGYTSFRIRGTDVNRINVTVNGIPLNDAESHGVWWVDLPDFASSVNNIQIQRGVGTSSLGAGAFGATINLQTFGINKKAYGEVNSSAGSFNTFKNTVSVGSGLINNHFTFDARLSKISSDGFIDRGSSDLKSFHLSGAYYDKKNMVKLNVISGTEVTYQAWDGIPGDILKTNRTYNNLGAYHDSLGHIQYYKNQTDNYQQDHYQLHYSHEFNSYLNATVALHYTRGKGYYEEFKENAALKNYGLKDVYVGNDTISETNLVRRKWLDNYFYGVTYALNYSKGKSSVILGGGYNVYDGKHYGNVIWARFMSNGEPNHRYYYGTGKKNDFNIFGKYTLQLTGQLSLFVDLQYRHIRYKIGGVDDDQRDIAQEHTFNFVNPKAGLNYKIGEGQAMYAFWGVAQREPSRSNYVDADPAGPKPTSEKMYDYELGYNASMGKVKANVNLYYMDYFDQLVLTGEINDVGSAIMTNVPRSFRQGVELGVEYQPVTKLTWNGNITLSRNKIKNFTEYVDNWDYWNNPSSEPLQYSNKLGQTNIAFSPSIIAGSELKFDVLKNASIFLNSKYVSKQYIDNTSNDAHVLHSYFVNDMRLSMSFKIRNLVNLQTLLSVNNLFNTKYETNAWLYQYIENGNRQYMDGYYPQAGRNFLLSMVLNF